MLWETVESMTHFGRLFDGVVAWGLVFLLLPTLSRRPSSGWRAPSALADNCFSPLPGRSDIGRMPSRVAIRTDLAPMSTED